MRLHRGAAPWLLACLGLASACSEPVAPAERIVLVTVDTLRADRLGCYGDEQAHTPVLDALARDGVRFRHASSPTPLTLPSHASIFTGLDPHQHGVRANGRFRLAPGVPTVAERMREAGFATAAFVASFVLDAQFGLARGFDTYDDRVGEGVASRAARSVSERKAGAVIDAANAWLATAPDRFFLWVHLYDPHADYLPPADFLARAGGDAYAGEIAYTDAQIGRLIGALRRRFGPEGLLFVVTSDHGESLGQHGEPTHGHGLYDTTQHVPLLMVGPGLSRGQVIEPVVRLIDLGPTLLARAGARALGDVAGRDLEPVLDGREREARVAYLETLETQLSYGWSPLLGLRTADHKYVRAPRPELYDLIADPDETLDIARAEPELVAELDRELDRILGATRFDAGHAEVDAEEQRRLAALGYLGAGNETPEPPELGVVGGPNPRDRVHEITLLMRAALQVGDGQGRDAMATLDGIQTRENAHYQQLRGQAALMTRDANAARAAADALAARGADQDALWLRAMAALFDGDAVAARRDLEALLGLAPERSSAAINLGRLDEAEGDPDSAAARYQAVLARDPDEALALAHLGALELRRGQVERAEQLLADRNGIVARSPVATLHLAAAERATGRADAAHGRLKAALRFRPDHRGLLAALGRPPAAAPLD
ncbi:MAG: sulfatase-like hydrolase/transferase [Deltaproteobacteria bacterium]|nr:sulfatase-like hydrolase/transferase [Deltaproteobacteria bacterium]